MNSEQQQTNKWIVRLFSLFLMLQACALAYLGFNSLYTIRWEAVVIYPAPKEALLQDIFTHFIFLLLSVPLLPAAFGFFFRLRFSWLLAMLSQALILFFCLFLYFNWRPLIIYPIMLASVIMVLYLNSNVLRAHFHASWQIGRDDDKQSS